MEESWWFTWSATLNHWCSSHMSALLVKTLCISLGWSDSNLDISVKTTLCCLIKSRKMNKIWLHIGKLQYVLEFITVRLHTISNKLSLNSLIVIIVVLKSQRSLHIRLFNNWISTLLLNDFIKAHSIQGLIKFKFNWGIDVKVIVQFYLNRFV